MANIGGPDSALFHELMAALARRGQAMGDLAASPGSIADAMEEKRNRDKERKEEKEEEDRKKRLREMNFSQIASEAGIVEKGVPFTGQALADLVKEGPILQVLLSLSRSRRLENEHTDALLQNEWATSFLGGNADMGATVEVPAETAAWLGLPPVAPLPLDESSNSAN